MVVGTKTLTSRVCGGLRGVQDCGLEDSGIVEQIYGQVSRIQVHGQVLEQVYGQVSGLGLLHVDARGEE